MYAWCMPIAESIYSLFAIFCFFLFFFGFSVLLVFSLFWSSTLIFTSCYWFVHDLHDHGSICPVMIYMIMGHQINQIDMRKVCLMMIWGRFV